MKARETSRGRSHPIGATVTADGVNFCIYSKHATAVELLLFDGPDTAQAAQVVRLDPDRNRTYHYWHVEVRGAGAGQVYGYRVYGPNQPEAGLRFDPAKLLLDPYARAVVNTENYQRARAAAPGDNTPWALRGVVVDPSDYGWEGDAPLRRASADPVIYEMHVAGFTRHPNSGVAPARRGTYAGLLEKVPYLQDLGIRAVELMPVQQFDAQAAPVNTNYWGYQPVAWFAPHRAYSSLTDPLGHLNEFRDLVKALHRAGIEVILDVVFNHTAEGTEHGPTLSLRGLDNPTYYLLQPDNPGAYVDDTGCGHTINGNETVVRRMILDCLRYWVEHMHVDGFRFDLASALSRGEDGTPLSHPPLLLDIEADPVLAGTKMIAEAWDAAGLYQVANFAGDRWAVWNGRFRDKVRRFVKGDRDSTSALADGLVGSASFFDRPGRDPLRSEYFITAPDCYTLTVLFSLEQKHNEANGQQNRDGANDNNSWNCGVEGATDDAAVEALRRRQVKNLITILLLSQGRPMLLMGDEIRRTQRGNNNAYCQDNQLSWLDWDEIKQHRDLRRFVAGLIGVHDRSSIFCDRRFWGRPGSAAVTWHGIRLNQPDWSQDSHSLAYELVQPDCQAHLHVMLNAYWEALSFDLPALPPGRQWHRLIDTALPNGHDFCEPPLPLTANSHLYRLEPRSSAVLIAAAE